MPLANLPAEITRYGLRATMKIALLCCMALAFAAQPALAQSPAAEEELREHLRAGERLFNLGKFDEAIKEFEAGYKIRPRPAFLYNLAQCYRQLEQYERSIWYFERYLALGTDPAYKREVTSIVAELRSALEKKEKTMPPTGPLRSEDSQSPSASGQLKATPAKVVTVFAPDKPWYADRLGWGMTGVGTLSLAVSAGLLINAESLARDANREPDMALGDQLHERAHDRRLIGTVVAVAGGATLVAGIIKLALHRNDQRSDLTARIRVGSNSIVVLGRF